MKHEVNDQCDDAFDNEQFSVGLELMSITSRDKPPASAKCKCGNDISQKRQDAAENAGGHANLCFECAARMVC